MMNKDNPEAHLYAEVFESVRKLSKMYISRLDGLDVDKRYEINGILLNSARWLAAHLVWAENYLIIEGLSGKSSGIRWLKKVEIGSKPPDEKELPSLDEIMNAMDVVHESSMKLLLSHSDEQLNEPNHIDATFGGKNTKRAVILHAIRHEPVHAGHISWILKANGVELV